MPAAPTSIDVTTRPVTSAKEAQQLIGHLNDVMDALLAIVEEETELVRAGQVADVARLEPTKSDLARLYLTDVSRLKSSSPYLAQAIPDVLADLRRRHDTFHALLQINLTVLATAHAVSEGIMRGLSAELARKAGPATYGPSGHTSAPGPSALVQPLTLSRTM
ncbi:MAG: hypothetical protein HY056_15910 [Proteobacteria bacterium]|nr:hypothetical protein [Pseudomonadota bacterium]